MAYFFSLRFGAGLFPAGFLADDAVLAASASRGGAAPRGGRPAGGRRPPFTSSLTPIVR
jgi:hypothetical protein